MARASTNRVAIYARVSTDSKGQDPENQLMQLRAWCNRIGYVVVHEYVDHESGAKGADQRKQFGRLFADAARREFDMVLVWALDRFTRNGMAATVVDLQRLNSYGVSFHSYSEPHLSTDNELVRDVLLAVLASLAKLEREKISQRTKAGLELSRSEPTRYHKISYDGATIERLFVDLFLEAHAQVPHQIILDLDATDDPLHGHQEGRFFHGYYDCYCYLPLYVFCGRHLLAAKLRPADIDGSAGAIEEAARLIAQIRGRWPEVRILLRADSGFARDPLMAWCENNGIDYLFGLAKNGRLVGEIESELASAAEISRMSGRPARRFKDFAWRTLDSWCRERRVVAKAEWTGGEANPRFIVTSLSRDEHESRHLYEKLYCARGDMENRIKECQLDLFSDRTSAKTMRANQLRLWFASMAYVLICALRCIALAHTQFARATCATIPSSC